ncbi:MAG: hypothetical protein ACOC3V_00475 [bacterium]
MKKEEIIKIQKEVKINQRGRVIILEKGDNIRVLKEASKISKKEFGKLHSSGELGLVQGGIPKQAEEIFNFLRSKSSNWINNEMKTIPVSRMDTGSQLSTGLKITVFTENIHGRDFYVVEDEIDNSLNNQVSWDTLDYFSTVYARI